MTHETAGRFIDAVRYRTHCESCDQLARLGEAQKVRIAELLEKVAEYENHILELTAHEGK